MRAALMSRAVGAPDWHGAPGQEERMEHSGPRSEDSRLPVREAERQALAEASGQQGRARLAALLIPLRLSGSDRSRWGTACGGCGCIISPV